MNNHFLKLSIICAVTLFSFHLFSNEPGKFYNPLNNGADPWLTYIIYSMCAADTPDYKLGMLVADESSNLMDPASWKQYPAPVFQRTDANSAFGPGHNGFFRSPDGSEDWIVYHAKTSATNSYSDRITRAQKFIWTTNGIPNFGVPVKLGELLDEPSGTKRQK